MFGTILSPSHYSELYLGFRLSSEVGSRNGNHVEWILFLQAKMDQIYHWNSLLNQVVEFVTHGVLRSISHKFSSFVHH
jgi:predicted Zn-dependent protease with MMP-like domain